jgi:hypothetical protein
MSRIGIVSRAAVLGSLLAGAATLLQAGAGAPKLTATVNPSCGGYTISLTAPSLDSTQAYEIDWTISGLGSAPISSQVTFSGLGSYNSGPITQSIAALNGSFTPTGTATLINDTAGATIATVDILFSPDTLSCSAQPPTCSGANSSLINNLGSSGPSNFAVLSMGGTGALVNINLATVVGNVGVPNFGTLKESAPSVVTGELVIGSSVNSSGVVGSHGPVVVNDAMLAQAVQDANTAATFFASLPSTPSVQAQFPANGQIATSLTVTGTPGLNVVNLPAFLLNNGSRTLTLTGPAGTAFVINDSGDFNLHAGNIAVGGGVGPLDVVYNITNPSATVTTMVPTKAVGILLAPNNTINTMDSATYTGEVIGAFGKQLVLMPGTHVTNPCQQ